MRRMLRVLGTLLVIGGIGMLAWAFTVWRWQDPVTAVYTHLEQRELSRGFDELMAGYVAPPAPQGEPVAVGDAAKAFRESLRTGDVVGRLEIPSIGVTAMIVEGTDDETLKRGPGRYSDLFLPGEGELVYVAGHRTTYSAPFSKIDHLRKGDLVVVEVPYGRFEYRITGHRIVREDELWVLESKGREVLALQACHPRFFATHRYIAYAEPVDAELRTAAGADDGDA